MFPCFTCGPQFLPHPASQGASPLSQMNASQEIQEDASSQNDQQEKTLTQKKYFYIFPGELKTQLLYPSPQELHGLWFFRVNSVVRTVLCWGGWVGALQSYSVSRGRRSPGLVVSWEDSHLLDMPRRAPPSSIVWSSNSFICGSETVCEQMAMIHTCTFPCWPVCQWRKWGKLKSQR